jgi:transcriptional regulator with XRE-family HTH domain
MLICGVEWEVLERPASLCWKKGGEGVTVQEEISRLAQGCHDLSEFLRKACALKGKGVTRASVEAGLSRNTMNSYVEGARRPSSASVYRVARYFGVPESDILRLAGLPTSAVRWEQVEGLGEAVRVLVASMDEGELREWLQYGEMVLLRRERRMMEESRGEVEG